MWITLKWNIPPYINGIIIYSTLTRKPEKTGKMKKKSQKWVRKWPYIILNLFRIFGQRILGAILKKLNMWNSR